MDEAFSRWLALREPIDAASRSSSVTEAALAAAARAARGAAAVHVLDLATGAGSNLRFLVERLPSPQRWLVVDHSPTLLTHLVERTATWGAGRGYDVRMARNGFTLRGTRLECQVDVRQEDLGTLEAEGLFEGRHLVTASALLDLASGRWLGTLADRCRTAGAAALFTTAYDGRSTSLPEEPEDTRVLELFNRHQRTDKGLGGVAAGPEAASMAVASFTGTGYQVRSAPSDWKVGPENQALQRTLIEGWAAAASAVAPEATEAIGSWLVRRLAHLDAGRSHIHVGHQDLAAWPTVG